MVKILLVEDDPTMLELLTTLFKLEGFEIETRIKNGNYLESVRDYSPDVVIIDVHLRVGGGVEVNGFDLLRQIRRDEFLKDSKVIMYSGMDLRLESKQSGADDFIMKPFMPDELIKKIKNLVE